MLHGADEGNGRGLALDCDLAGRVFKGVPAPYNLPVRPCHFISKQSVRIGENPPDVTWDFGDIQQI